MLYFWKQWDNESKWVFGLLYFTFFISVLLLVYFWAQGSELVYTWEELVSWIEHPVTVDVVHQVVADFPLEVPIQVAQIQYVGSSPQLNSQASLLVSLLIAIALLTGMAIMSYLKNWIYFAGNLLVISYITFQQPEVVVDNVPSLLLKILPILFFGLPGYWFTYFANNTKFITRLAVYLLIGMLYYGSLYYISSETNTWNFYFANSFWVGLLITLLFFFFIGYEWMLLLLKLITKKGTLESGYLLHYSIFILLYLSYLVSQYLYLSKNSSMELFFISPTILFISSAIVGIWSMKDKSLLWYKSLPFYPFGATLYLCWALFSTSFVAMAHAFQNDPILEIVDDFVLFAHIGVGLGFFLYVFVYSSSRSISKNIGIVESLFTTHATSMFSVYGAAVLVTLSFVFYSNIFSLKQAYAAYYNYLGDAFAQSTNADLSYSYYKQSLDYEFQNHHANYALGQKHLIKGELAQAESYFKKATLKMPSAQAYANWAMCLQKQDKNLEALLKLQSYKSNVPSSPHLENNLGILFQELGFKDSALIYIDKAHSQGLQQGGYVNKLGLLIRNNWYNQLDISELQKPTTFNALQQSQQWAYKLAFDIKDSTATSLDFPKDTLLTEILKNCLIHYALLHKERLDTSYIGHIEKIALIDTNRWYKSEMLYAYSIAQYYSGDKVRALKVLDELNLENMESGGNHVYTIGLWALQNQVYAFAYDVFALASKKGHKKAPLMQAYTAALLGDWKYAIPALHGEDIMSDTSSSVLAKTILDIFSFKNATSLATATDAEKLVFIHFRLPELTDIDKGNVFFSMKDPQLRLHCANELLRFYLSEGNLDRCFEIIEYIGEVSAYKPNAALDQYQYLTLCALTEAKMYDKMQVALLQTTWAKPYADTKSFFEGMLEATYGDKQLAIAKFKKACAYNPMNEYIMHRANEFFVQAQSYKDAYQNALNGVEQNPYSVTLLMDYCKASIYFGIPSFGDNALNRLSGMTSPSAFLKFKQEYESLKLKIQDQLMQY